VGSHARKCADCRAGAEPIHFPNPDIPRLELALAALFVLAHHLLLDVWVVFVVIPSSPGNGRPTKPSTKKVYPITLLGGLSTQVICKPPLPFALNTTVMVLLEGHLGRC